MRLGTLLFGRGMGLADGQEWRRKGKGKGVIIGFCRLAVLSTGLWSLFLLLGLRSLVILLSAYAHCGKLSVFLS